MYASVPLLLAQEGKPGLGTIIGIGLVALLAVVVLIVFATYGKLWFQAYMSNAQVSIFSLIGMTFRQVNARVIVQAKIMALQAGITKDPRELSTQRLEAHYLAGGNVPGVISAIIAAHRADIDLDFDRAAAIDLAGRDVLDAVRTSVHPKVIDCPNPKKTTKPFLSAIAKNGVELRIRARVTVRTNLAQLIGGATEDTIVARVGEGIITSIGSSQTHLAVMENPDLISRAVLHRGLDAHTAFEIVSIDIADIDVGENIGARLQADQAEADTRVAQAKAEERRAFATALEQEMKARTAENRSLVLKAESEVPRAMAEAFRAGRLTDLIGSDDGTGRLTQNPVTQNPVTQNPGVAEPQSGSTQNTQDTDIFTVLLDAMCCIMVADGETSDSEKGMIQKIIRRVHAPLTLNQVEDHIATFSKRVQSDGLSAVVDAVCRDALIFKEKHREKVLLACLEAVMKADRKLEETEQKIIDRFREVVS